jgi:hypothetical protein
VAQRVITTLIDDLDGSDASVTVSFALDGSEYEIDLNDEHAAQMRDTFAHYMGAARKANGQPAHRRTRGPATARPTSSTGQAASGDKQQIREWARANGHQVSERGRLSAAVMQAYQAAHG